MSNKIIICGVCFTILYLIYYLWSVSAFYSIPKTLLFLNTAPEKIILPPGVIAQFDLYRNGLGNHLFYYACSYSISKSLSIPLYLELGEDQLKPSSSDPKYYNSRRVFSLHFFNIPLNKDNLILTSKNSSLPYSKNDTFIIREELDILNKTKLPRDKLLIVGDTCGSYRFFENEIDELKGQFQLSLDEQSMAEIADWNSRINTHPNNSVAIHIRRGDYKRLEGWVTPISWYIGAMNLMNEKLGKGPAPNFFIFSDSIKEVISDLESQLNQEEKKKLVLNFVSSKNSSMLQDFFLMTQCAHFIISNSTYSWWAAFLAGNKNKIVIAAKFGESFYKHYRSKGRMEKKKWVYEHNWVPSSWIHLAPDYFSNNNLTSV